MRQRLSVLFMMAVFAAYTVVWIGVAAVTAADGFEFAKAFESAEFSRNLVWGLGAGAAFGIVVTTWSGWWRPVLGGGESPIDGWPRKLPLILLVLILVTTDYREFPDVDAGLLVWIAAASLLVGFAEELVFRGVVVVGLRRSGARESAVWLISTALFALIHLPNVVLGAEVAPTIVQTVLAFAGGTFFYVVRRATDSILPAMALHCLWDFTLFAAGHDVLGAIRVLVEIGLFVALVVGRRRLFGASPGPESADTAPVGDS